MRCGSLEVSEHGRNRLTIHEFQSVCLETIALSCTIFQLFDVEECRDLEGSFKVIGNDIIR